MNISLLVRNITATFDDASALVKRIRERNTEIWASADQPPYCDNPAIQDLLESLELGPIVIRGYYASDAKRFGLSYTNGDGFAQEQLKDVLLHLQLTVLTTLRAALVDNSEPDYAAIQSASHDCRVNAGVCLGQLSQRLADPNRVQKGPRLNMTAFPLRIPTPGLHNSADMSTDSNDSPRTPTTPEMEAALEFDYPGRFSDFNPHASNLRGKAFAVLQGSGDSPPEKIPGSSHSSMEVWMKKQMEADEMMCQSRRPSSSCLSADDNPVFSPISPVSSGSHWTQNSPVSSGIMSHFGSISREKKKTNSDGSFKDRFSPDDYLDVQKSDSSESSTHRRAPSESSISVQSSRLYRAQTSPIDELPRPSSKQRSSVANQTRKRRSTITSTAGRETATVPLILASSVYSNTAPPHPISPVEEEVIPPPVPRRSAARKPARPPPAEPLELLKPGAKKILGDIDPVLDSFLGVLNLPTEKNLLGYCKSAWRLQAGSDKKAFSPAHRPLGFSSMVQFWKCEKCPFEGPLTTISAPAGTAGKTNKPEKIFDPAIREYDGIRFKWIFLAKCHVPAKSSAAHSHKPDGSSGSFGCIFCTAEGSHRGWLTKASTVDGTNEDRPTTSRGRSKKVDSTPSISGGTPIFGNSHSFMEHLQMHRQRNYWPNKEMQKRTKCVVGRIAGRGEDFDINFMPLEVGS